MKIKIEYEYDASQAFPYFATYQSKEGGKKYFCSNKDFLEAKTKLLDSIKMNQEILVPEPEEVEI